MYQYVLAAGAADKTVRRLSSRHNLIGMVRGPAEHTPSSPHFTFSWAHPHILFSPPSLNPKLTTSTLTSSAGYSMAASHLYHFFHPLTLQYQTPHCLPSIARSPSPTKPWCYPGHPLCKRGPQLDCTRLLTTRQKAMLPPTGGGRILF